MFCTSSLLMSSSLPICVFDKFNPMKYKHKIQVRKGR